MIQLGSHFADSRGSRHADARRQREWFIKARNDRERRDETADRLDDQLLVFASAAVVATELQIKQFEQRLDRYEVRLDAYETKLDSQDIAVTKALMENQLELERLFALREQILEAAFVLPDGRRVFKSEDGITVYDESHAIVGLNVIDPNDIPDSFVRHEKLLGVDQLISSTEAERDKLHKAQDDIDAARDKLSIARSKLGVARSAIEDGNLTVQDIEEMDADIEASIPTKLPNIPASAMKHLSGIENAADIPDAENVFTAKANPDTAPFPQSANPTIQPEIP